MNQKMNRTAAGYRKSELEDAAKKAAYWLNRLLAPEKSYGAAKRNGGLGHWHTQEVWNEDTQKEAPEALEALQAALRGVQAEKLEAMLAELACPIGPAELDHVTIRRCGGPASPLAVMVYRRDATSPTGCMAWGGVDDCAETRAVLAKRGHGYGVGPQRGTMAGRGL